MLHIYNVIRFMYITDVETL